MYNRWTRLTKLSVIDFMVYSKGIPTFLKFVDALNQMKNHKYIIYMLNVVIKNVNLANVEHFVTNNGSHL